METMSLDLFLLKKQLIETEQKFQEAKGELRLMRKRAKSLSCISKELMIRKRELKRQIQKFEAKRKEVIRNGQRKNGKNESSDTSDDSEYFEIKKTA